MVCSLGGRISLTLPGFCQDLIDLFSVELEVFSSNGEEFEKFRTLDSMFRLVRDSKDAQQAKEIWLFHVVT